MQCYHFPEPCIVYINFIETIGTEELRKIKLKIKIKK